MNNPFDHTHIQEERAEREAHRLKLRTNLLIALFCAVLGGFVAVLYQTQVVHGGGYLVSTNNHIAQPQQVDSVRGEILDSCGRVLVTNEVGYNVELDWDAMGSQRNEILTRLLEICREEGVEWTDTMPLTKTAPWCFTSPTPFSYQDTTEEGETVTVATALGRLTAKCKVIGDPKTDRMPADEWYTAMCRAFGVVEKDGEPTQEDRDLAGVLYELNLRQREVSYSTYVFARGVDISFITKVKENNLAGVRIETATSRKYETHYAAHVLGYTGAIDDTKMDYYKELGYPMNAEVGRGGVELAFEERLHGVSGKRIIEKDEDGNIISQQWETAPEPGENVVLTLDIALQSTVEDILAQYVARRPEEDRAPMAAAVVDMSGGVLALASYPSYDMTTFWDDYNDLVSDTELTPLVNRATQGRYAPGSTFKMLTSIAALDTGTITVNERVPCNGRYTFYSDAMSQPWCWLRSGHGLENVSRAITDSCDIFYYDVGRRTTIAKITEYAQKFGLGEYTGIEIPEVKGHVAGPETSAAYNQPWYDGDTMYAAIGQGMNEFTPLQLANYVATLVNGGSHYACHLLKEYKASDYSTVTEVFEPELLNTIDIQPEHLAAVKKGMYDLSKTAGMARFFDPLPVEVGCKTGTAETQSKAASTNVLFVCFAPYDDPQVALCIVAEDDDNSTALGEVAAGILAQYFATGSSLSTATGENTLLR